MTKKASGRPVSTIAKAGQFSVTRGIVPSWQWTDYIKLEQIDAESVSIKRRSVEVTSTGLRLGKARTQTMRRNPLLRLGQCLGHWSWAQIEEDYLCDYGPAAVGIDKVSWYHLRQNEHSIRELFKAWVQLGSISPITIHTIDDLRTLHFTQGVCRLSAPRAEYQLQNGSVVLGALPRSIIDGISNLPMTTIVEAPEMPVCAIAVDAAGNDNKTTIRYDVEVISLERIFARKRSIMNMGKHQPIKVSICD